MNELCTFAMDLLNGNHPVLAAIIVAALAVAIIFRNLPPIKLRCKELNISFGAEAKP